MKSDLQSLKTRTMTAWVRRYGADRAKEIHEITRQVIQLPDGNRTYMVVRGKGTKILAVYRVRLDGMLKFLRRHPQELIINYDPS